MAKTNFGRIIVIVLFVALGVSIWRTYVVDKQRKQVEADYTQATQQVTQLETERSRLTDQLVESKKAAEGQAQDIKNLQQELSKAQSELQDSLSSMTALQKEHNELRRTHDSTLQELASVASERDDLKAKFSDIKQLKLAILDVRRKIWNQRFASWRARRDAQRNADQELLASGNRGYVVRDGTLTLVSPNRLQVHVLEPQPQ